MTDLKQKYPFLFFEEIAAEESLSPEQQTARLRDIWKRKEALSSSARAYVRNIELFTNSRFHDSSVISVALAEDTLTFALEDNIFLGCFCVVNGLLGLGVPYERIKCPVTVRLEGISHLAAYQWPEEAGDDPRAMPDAVAAADLLPRIKIFLDDEISRISPRGVSIGFNFGTRRGMPMILDVDARRLRFEENSRALFASLFGAENLDIFDALWQARARRKLVGDVDPAIRIILGLRPELPRDYDVRDYYIWCALQMRADDLARAGRLDDAVPLYKELIPSPWDRRAIWGKLAECLVRLGRFSEALVYVYAILGWREKDLDARFLLARIWHHLGNLEDAAAELRKCLALDPQFEEARRFALQHKKMREILEPAMCAGVYD